MAFNFDSVKDILVCPKCKTSLVHEADTLVCRNGECRLQYEIRDDIPVMLIDEATELSPEQWQSIVDKHAASDESGSGGDG